ncbi:hypothetical protein SAMN05421847_0806 [Halpernia humi]|uniref:VOC domain-containing protein n=1 Tax=Halpernia humi TaxID=493375 RepID=A0A1H5UJR0_9FLAO|nr:VOC family protein [Halpernia humi]SEF74708.1 hypothetical protein SAMN05421847_0806 [Halpernia humi]
MKFNLNSIIFYVQNVDRLKFFYEDVFNFKIIEEYHSEWALLETGNCKLGLHKIGAQYLKELKEGYKFDNNAKLIFEIDEDINEVRQLLIEKKVAMREIKTFQNYDFWLCDGEDLEGNVFQIKMKKK